LINMFECALLTKFTSHLWALRLDVARVCRFLHRLYETVCSNFVCLIARTMDRSQELYSVKCDTPWPEHSNWIMELYCWSKFLYDLAWKMRFLLVSLDLEGRCGSLHLKTAKYGRCASAQICLKWHVQYIYRCVHRRLLKINNNIWFHVNLAMFR
jgi:hypothetical protein